jgi:hypothetical protein
VSELPGDITLAQLREFVDRLSDRAKYELFGDRLGTPVRASQGVITAIDWPTNTCSFKELGDTVSKFSVSWANFGFVPKVGDTAWMLKWGNDGIVFASPSANLSGTTFTGRVPAVAVWDDVGMVVPANMVAADIIWTGQGFDTDDMFNTAVSSTKFVYRTQGLYYIGANLVWPATATGNVDRWLQTDKNNAGIIDWTKTRYFTNISQHEYSQQVGSLHYLQADDFTEFRCLQGGTGPLTLPTSLSGVSYPAAWAFYIGPR